MHELGVRPAPARAAERTLDDAIDDLLARKRVSGRHRPLRVRGLEHWERSCSFWRVQRFAQFPLRLLDVATVEDAHLARAASHPTAAKHELEALKAALRYAAQRGSEFPLGLLSIEPIRLPRSRKGKALTLEEHGYFCRYAPEHQRITLDLFGTVGLRITEALSLDDRQGHVDLEGHALHIPAELCKEGRDKTIPLLLEEVLLYEEQLDLRPKIATRVHCRKGGTPWRREHFYGQVVVPTRIRAAVAWRREHDLPPDAPTPFEWPVVIDGRIVMRGIAPHDFRRTAATLMRDNGFTKEEAATRFGHGDDGELLDELYDQGDRVRRVRVAIEEIGGIRDVLDAAGAGRRRRVDAGPMSRPSTTTHLRVVR